MHSWTFVLTDLKGVQIGEVTDADSRVVSLPLNRLPTASFVLKSDHPLADELTNPDWDGLLKCYRDGIPRFVGPVVGTEDQWDSTSGTQKLAVNAAGPLWRLAYRQLGITAGWSSGNLLVPVDLGLIAHNILDEANAGHTSLVACSSGPYTGITKGTRPAPGVLASGATGEFFFKPADAAIAELSAAINGFDYEVVPQEPVDIGAYWPEIGKLNIYALRSTAHPEVIFEFGGGSANLASYGRTLDRSNLGTLGWIQQPAASDHSGILHAVDAAAEHTRGRFEILADDGGVEWDSLRQDIVDQNVSIRKRARYIITIQPIPNVTPSALSNFAVGDVVHVVLNVNGRARFNGDVRIWAVTFSIDKDGNEVQTLQTIPQ